MTLIDQIFQLLLSGITMGSIYALIAIGFNIIYNTTNILNFAQGEFVMLGGMCMIMFHSSFHINIFISFFLSIIAVTLIGIGVEKFTIHPIKNPSLVTLILITIAVSSILKALAMLTWGKDSYPLAPFSSDVPIRIGGAAILPQIIWIISISIVIVVLLIYLFRFTYFGKALLATAINKNAAEIMGIDIHKMINLSFALSAAIGAVAGGVITPITLMEYNRGAILGIKGFAVSIFGGVGNFLGSIVAGLIIGIAEAFCAGFISSGYKDALTFFIMIIVLFVKPEGLLGKNEVE